MFIEKTDQLYSAFGLKKNRYIYLIGGGGKTSLMYALAAAIAREGYSVLSTTTTRIMAPAPDQAEALVVGQLYGIQKEFLNHRRVTAAHHYIEGEAGKLKGFAPQELDEFYESGIVEYVIVEADGSAGRSLKAHADYEPVLSARADLVIAVIGIDCIGAAIDDDHVHRAKLFCEMLGIPAASTVTEEAVARIFFHEDGYLKKVAKDSEVRVFINKVANDAEKGRAKGLARALKEYDRANRIANVVIGDVNPMTEQVWISTDSGSCENPMTKQFRGTTDAERREALIFPRGDYFR